MTLKSSGLGSVFQEGEPEQASNARPGMMRPLTPNESDKMYKGLDWDDADVAAIREQREKVQTPSPSIWSRIGGPVVKAMTWYSEKVSQPLAEMMTFATRSVFDGYGQQVVKEREALAQAWRNGSFWSELTRQRKERPDIRWGEKLIGEILFDPATYAGWGFLRSGAMAGGKAAYRLGVVGRTLGPLDDLYIRGSNAALNAVVFGPAGWAAKSIPGLKGLTRLSPRSAAAMQEAHTLGLIRQASTATFQDNKVGGGRAIVEGIKLKNTSGVTLNETEMLLVTRLQDLEDYYKGTKRFTFKQKGDVLEVVEDVQQRLDAAGVPLKPLAKTTPAEWELVTRAMDSETTQQWAARVARATGVMVRDSRAMERILERRNQRNEVWRMVMDASDAVAARLNKVGGSTINRAFAELVLGFQTYAPFNIIEDGMRSWLGGEGIRMLDDDLAMLLVGSTRTAIPMEVLGVGGEMLSDANMMFANGMRNGTIDRLADSNQVVAKSWTVLGGWSLRTSKWASSRLRRGYIFNKARRYNVKLKTELLDQLAAKGDGHAIMVKSFMEGLGESLAPLDHKARNAAVDYAWTMLGIDDPEAIRNGARIIARVHLPTSQADAWIAEHMGDFTHASRVTLRNMLTSGERNTEKFAENFTKAYEEIMDNEWRYAMNTAPENAKVVVDWLLTKTRNLALTNKDEMSQLLTLAATMNNKQMEMLSGTAATIISQARHKSPAALRTTYAKTAKAIDEIQEVFANAEVRSLLPQKLREAAATLAPGDDAARQMLDAADAFEKQFANINDAYTQYLQLRNEWFGAASGIRPEKLALYANENVAWEEFGQVKNLIFTKLAALNKPLTDNVLSKAQLLGLDGMDVEIRALLEEKLKAARDAAAAGTKTYDPVAARAKKLDKLRDLAMKSQQKGALSPDVQTLLENTFNGLADLSNKFEGTSRIAMQKASDDAWKQSIDEYHKWFTNYDDTMALDDIMGAFMPFWRYESRRWPTMARFVVTHPGVGRTFLPSGYFWQATDEGYIPYDILGSGLEAMPIRGTLFGTLRRAYRRSYPPEHAGFVGRVEGVKQLAERVGFYGGPWQTWLGNIPLQALAGDDVSAGLTTNLGEDLPAPIQTILLSVAGVGVVASQEVDKLLGKDKAKAMQEAISTVQPNRFRTFVKKYFPNRFFDYNENIYFVSTYGLTRADIEADPDKQWMLDDGFKQMAWRQVLSDQIAIMRYHPKGFVELRSKVDQMTAELAGVDVAVVRDIRDSGRSPYEVLNFSRVDKDIVTAMEEFKLVSSVFTPLAQTEIALVRNKLQTYYRMIDEFRAQDFKEQLEDDNALSTGSMTSREWREALRDRESGRHDREVGLQSAPEFDGVPFSKEGRAAFNDRFSIANPVKSDVDAVLDAYYEVPLVENPDTGDPNWSAFFDQRKAILELLPDDIRVQVQDYLLRKETPTVKEFKQAREFMKPYWEVDTYVPLWLKGVGAGRWAQKYTIWKDQMKKAEREALRAHAQGAPPELVDAVTRRPEFTAVRRWETEYRTLMRDPDNRGGIPWADPRISMFWEKFYKEL